MKSTKQEMKSGAKLLVEALEHQHVDLIFGYPGGAVLPLYDEFYKSNIPHILTRHEQGAVHAAEGYARVTGKPGVVVVTSGPGATNALTGIADAMSDSIPLVVFTGQVHQPGIGKDAFQEADMIGLTTPITKYNYQIRDVKELPRIVNEAFYIASTGRKGPVVIDIPKDIGILTTATVHPIDIELPGYHPESTFNEDQLSRVFQLLKKAKKPLILAGAGIHHSGAVEALQEFSQYHQIPVLTSLLGLGSIPHNDPLFLGMGGMHGSYAANMALSECDVLLNFGARFDDRLATKPTEFAPNAAIVHVDIDPAELGKVIQTDVPIHGDCQEVLTQLLTMQKEPLFPQAEWLRTSQLRKTNYPYKYTDSTEIIKPQKAIELIGEITNGEAIVTTDVGQHQMWVAQFYPFKERYQLVTSGGLGTMGFGIPAAIGAQFAYPEKLVVCFVGDGGFQMTNQELAILNDYQLNVKFIILNNGVLGMVKQWQEKFHGERFSHSIFNSQPNFVKLADAYGIKGVQLTDPTSLEADLKAIFNEVGPAVIDIIVDSNELVLPMVVAGQPNHCMEGVE
ncbi:biosynthetic-type acetolactate synthase large subunit [Carnobacterium divergens]|uniref:biosynthetic-type acetolactate synthase large subunit n=1 Tax=Carnobacterium divergens TaxID=2748 RepID=UPI0039AFFC67